MKHGFLIWMFSIVAIALMSGCAQKTEKVNAYKIVMNSHMAVTPAPRTDLDWWMPRHHAIIDRNKQGNIDLLFIGDSITHGWEYSGKDVWNSYYAKRNAVNLGFGADGTQQVLWRLSNGEIAGISPTLAVVMIGTNNSNAELHTAREVSEGIIAICQKLRHDLPKTKILILAIFPRGEKPSAQREKNAEASKLASMIADDKWIYYLDINYTFLDKDGTLPKEVMPDFLHPNAKGYEIEARAIEPTIQKLLGEKK